MLPNIGILSYKYFVEDGKKKKKKKKKIDGKKKGILRVKK